MSDIILRSYDLMIRKVGDDDVVSIKASLAFDPEFIKNCRAAGVHELTKREE